MSNRNSVVLKVDPNHRRPGEEEEAKRILSEAGVSFSIEKAPLSKYSRDFVAKLEVRDEFWGVKGIREFVESLENKRFKGGKNESRGDFEQG